MEDRVARLEADNQNLKDQIAALRSDIADLVTNQKINAVRYDQIREDLAAIKKILNWIVVIVIGGLITAALNWVVQGGLAIGN